MSALGKAQAAKAAGKAFLKLASSKGRQVLLRKSESEILAEDATNADPWGPTGQQMSALSDAAFDAEKFADVWKVVLKRLGRTSQDWRHVYKTLLLIEFMVKQSSQHVVQAALDSAPILEQLQKYQYKDEGGKDWGLNVRNRAKEICELLARPDRIREERAKARSNKDKYTGGGQSAQGGKAVASSGNSTGPAKAAAGQDRTPDRGAKSSKSPVAGDLKEPAGSTSTRPWMDSSRDRRRLVAGREAEGTDGEPEFEPGWPGFAGPAESSIAAGSAMASFQVATKPTLHELTQDKPAASRKLRDIKVNPSIAASFVAPARGPVALPASPACQLHASEPAGDAWQSAQSQPASEDLFRPQWDSDTGKSLALSTPDNPGALWSDDPFAQLADSRGTAAAPKLGGVAIRLTASATGGSAMPMRGTPGAGIPSTRQPSAQPDLFSDFNPFNNGE